MAQQGPPQSGAENNITGGFQQWTNQCIPAIAVLIRKLSLANGVPGGSGGTSIGSR